MAPDGTIIVPPIYEWCYYCGKESFLVSTGTRYLVINQSGDTLFSCSIEEAELYPVFFLNDERYIVVYNECGQILIYDTQDNLSYTVDEWVNKDETLSLINRNIVDNFDWVCKYWDNIYFAKGPNGWRFYNINGDEMQEAKINYDEEGIVFINDCPYSCDATYSFLRSLKQFRIQ